MGENTEEMNPKHELKQKINGALKRFNKAVTGHPKENAIRTTTQYAIGEGANALAVFELGIRMCNEDHGTVIIDEVNISWGDKA
jgi:hypothetical protein